MKFAFTVVKDVFYDVNCVKCKKCMVLCLLQSSDTLLKVLKANLKAKIMNAYFQCILYYKSERKDLKH